MNTTDEPLQISTDVLDALFVHALRGYVAQAIPPRDIWKHIKEDVQRFPARGDFDMSHLPQASYPLFTEIQQRL